MLLLLLRHSFRDDIPRATIECRQQWRHLCCPSSKLEVNLEECEDTTLST